MRHMLFASALVAGIFFIMPVGAQDAVVEKIADGFQFTEGPVLLDSGTLLFSDIWASTIYQWTAEQGASVFLNPSGKSNGLNLDIQGRLLMAQHEKRRIARLEENDSETALATYYNGKRLNSPNDIAVKSDGSIFFTDPPYGIQPFQQELSFSGIYRISPIGEIQVLDSSLYRPNGIGFSPNESKLYVSDSESRIVYVWDVKDDSILINRQEFARMNQPGNADGMAIDKSGRLFVAGPGGLWVYTSEGETLHTIPVPGQVTNCCWGNAEQTVLFVTSENAIYKIYLNETTNHSEQGFNFPDVPCLIGNYPNPFNETTRIYFKIHHRENVQLTMYNMQGELIQILLYAVLIPGDYYIPWQADLPSASYVYALSTGSGIQTGRCLLVK